MSDEDSREQLRLKAALGRSMGSGQIERPLSRTADAEEQVSDTLGSEQSQAETTDYTLVIFANCFCVVVGVFLLVLVYTFAMSWSYQNAFPHSETRPSIWSVFPVIMESNIEDLLQNFVPGDARPGWNEELEKIQVVLERKSFLLGHIFVHLVVFGILGMIASRFRLRFSVLFFPVVLFPIVYTLYDARALGNFGLDFTPLFFLVLGDLIWMLAAMLGSYLFARRL